MSQWQLCSLEISSWDLGAVLAEAGPALGEAAGTAWERT